MSKGREVLHHEELASDMTCVGTGGMTMRAVEGKITGAGQDLSFLTVA